MLLVVSEETIKHLPHLQGIKPKPTGRIQPVPVAVSPSYFRKLIEFIVLFLKVR